VIINNSRVNNLKTYNFITTMLKYKDPENSGFIIDSLHEAPTLKEVNAIIKSVYPTWMISVLEKYSDDYPSLTSNWQKICSEIGVSPAKIIIVDFLPSEKNATDFILIASFSEILTRSGFSIRRKQEFVLCSKCSALTPKVSIRQKLKDAGEKVPETWSSNCSTC
jgi:hypothetical protein